MTTVTLRMPEDVVDDLKRLAPRLGFSGYQPLMRAYIGQGLRADLQLASASFAEAHRAIEREVRDACRAIEAALASAPAAVSPTVVRVSWALGVHGRGFDDGVIVGAHAAWNGLDAQTPAAVALHEHAVLLAAGDYARREWSALCSVARLLERGPDALRTAHARWVGAVDLTEVLGNLVSAGALGQSDAHAISTASDSRAALLARVTV